LRHNDADLSSWPRSSTVPSSSRSTGLPSEESMTSGPAAIVDHSRETAWPSEIRSPWPSTSPRSLSAIVPETRYPAGGTSSVNVPAPQCPPEYSMATRRCWSGQLASNSTVPAEFSSAICRNSRCCSPSTTRGCPLVQSTRSNVLVPGLIETPA
jgi:hypothetical protein